MKQLFLNFLRPYVLQIIKQHLVVTKTDQTLKNRSVVADVSIEEEPKPVPPIDINPPIIP